ncbi:porin [Indioceanicola profundi]|uniref:porin n=1 Tax=Indioceanicola profundi TaxID=2220096 RepID=UPI0013C4A845|nr:porin [Indioceanicola profundi]
MFTRSARTALMTGGAVIGLMLASAAPAAAQNSEVEMLRGQVQELLNRIERLEKSPAAAPAPTVTAAPTIAQGNPKVKVTFGGWINRAVTYADNGADDDFLFVDNNGASSRFNISASGKVNDSLSLGSVLELEAISNNARSTGLESQSTALSFNERKMEVWAQVENVGRIWLGQGDMASNVVSEVDLSGTANLGIYSDIGATFGGLNFATGGASTTVNVQSAFQNFDGLNRDDRVRFDTTSIAGFTASASASHGGNYDAALRYAGKFGDTSVSAAVGYWDFADDFGSPFEDGYAGSISVKLASGINATVAAGEQNYNTGTIDSATYWYGKLGYAAKFSPIGQTAFAIDYYEGSDIRTATTAGVTVGVASDATAYGVTMVQQLDAISSEVYVSVRNHELDAGGVNYRDVLGVMTGARVRF